MKTWNHARWSAGALLCALGLIGHTTLGYAHGDHKHTARPTSQSSAAKFEITFLETMIDHHAMAVEMARVCSSRAEHSELRQVCEQVKSAQQAEITTMQSWLHSWYGRTHEPRMKSADMRQIERLEGLSGSDFEIAFMEMLIDHHRKAIREADRCLKRATHDELKGLCQEVHTAQSAEITQLQTWLCQWYQKECQ